jgi:hypothetical protein
MNTELMVKAQTLLYSNTDKLKALVEALESVCNESNTEVPEIPKHPLINYTVSEKDIGSLVKLWDTTEAGAFTSFLTSIDKGKVDLHYGNKDAWWDNAEPYTDTFKLHFKPWVPTEEDVPPKELKDCVGFAVLLENGGIVVSMSPNYVFWDKDKGNSSIVGYCKLDFVNPILDK